MVSKCLLGHPETGAHRGKFDRQALLDFSLAASSSLCYDAKVMFPSFKQILFSPLLIAKLTYRK